MKVRGRYGDCPPSCAVERSGGYSGSVAKKLCNKSCRNHIFTKLTFPNRINSQSEFSQSCRNTLVTTAVSFDLLNPVTHIGFRPIESFSATCMTVPETPMYKDN